MDNFAHLILIIVLTLILDFLTGTLSSPSVITAIVASRAMSPRRALFLSTTAKFIGPFLFGTAVARAIGDEVIAVEKYTILVIYAVLGASIFWTLISWLFHLPSSSSHAQLGALFGAAIVAVGAGSLKIGGIIKVIVGLALVAPIGLIGGYIVLRLCYGLASERSPRVNRVFSRAQYLTAIFLGLTIGSNTAQRAMAMMALGMVVTGYSKTFVVTDWIVFLGALGLALGNLLGGARMIRSLSFYQLRPIHGFSSQLAAAIVILGGSLIGAPMSTTHVTGLATVGAGVGDRISMVRWSYVGDVLKTWILTTPLCALLGAAFYLSLRLIFGGQLS